MGLIEERQKMANLEYRKAHQDAEKATKRAEKLQKQLDNIKEEKQRIKEFEHDQHKAVEIDLRNAFIKVFEKYGTEKAIILLNLKTTRDDILSQVPENDFEYNWAFENYNKILKKIQEIYIKDQNAKKILKRQQEEKEKLKEEKENTILYIIFFILSLPFKIIKYILIFFAMIFFNIKTK